MKKIKLNGVGSNGSMLLSRTEMKNVMGGVNEPVVALPCDNVVCQPDSWCCDGRGICISRSQTTC